MVSEALLLLADDDLCEFLIGGAVILSRESVGELLYNLRDRGARSPDHGKGCRIRLNDYVVGQVI